MGLGEEHLPRSVDHPDGVIERNVAVLGIGADLAEGEDVRRGKQEVVQDLLRRPLLELGQAMDRFGRALAIIVEPLIQRHDQLRSGAVGSL